MTRIAILGANGQVGAELCLILRNHSEVEVIPICRNRQGSAFLRYSGMRCRHGLPADPEQAAALFGDCDIVVNSALAGGTPKQIRVTERALISNSLAFSPAHAKVIYFSTQMVHGDPSPGAWIRWLSAYARAKRHSEGLVRTCSARVAKPAYILRLGHVCGELQSITAGIRERIRTNSVFLPADDRPSNTVYTCTIADAILKIAAGKEEPGTYDLMSVPEWSWREVYSYEAEQCKVPLEAKIIKPPAKRNLLGMFGMSKLPNQRLREFARGMIAHTSVRWNERLQAKWFQMRARQEIQALRQEEPYHDALVWVAMGKKFLTSLTPTRELLEQPIYHIAKRNPANAWAADLPLAFCT